MQLEVVDALLGRDGPPVDVMAILPTSAGKTALFQIPSLVRPGPVVVVSPLVALMNDQVDRCVRAGIRAHALHSHQPASVKRRIVDDVSSGQARILYVSPERLQGLGRDFFGDHPPQLFAIDEAHCVSEWGHDFRPAYRRVGRNLGRFGEVQKLVLTATATPQVADEISRIVGLGASAKKIVRSPDRPNIRYAMAGEKVPVTRMIQFVELPALVYGSTQRSVEEAARELRTAGYRAAHYHAGMGKDERRDVQTKFQEGQYDVVAATCAFGMGIDHPGIRAVIHLEMPTSIEAYVQESGRAGRDGKPSIAICRATMETLDTAMTMSLRRWPEPRRVQAFWKKLSALIEQRASRWEGGQRLQMTNQEIGNHTDTHPDEAGACVSILDETGVIRQTPANERPVRVVLLRGASVKLRPSQLEILGRLADEADATGLVEGTVSYFSDAIGMDKEAAQRLSVAGAIRYEWVDRCQIIELADGRIEDLDGQRLMAMRARAVRRIEACKGYVSCSKCRRRFLLQWFQAEPEGPPLVKCCDNCPK